MPQWFRRFGDIDGLAYTTPAHIDRSSLAGHDDVPEVHAAWSASSPRGTLRWPLTDGGSTSASPAHHRAFSTLPNNRELPAAALLRNVHEGLELPGEPADYHFLIQRTADALWRRQRNEPQLCLEVEQLCWLDISLIKVRPDAAGDVVDGHWKFHAITGFWLLIQLYEGGSDPARALQVAEIAALYGQCENARQRLARKTDAEQTPSASPWAPIPPQHLEEPQPIVRRGSEPAGDGDHPSGKMESIMGAGEWAKILTHDWNEEGGIDFLVFYGAGPDYVGTTAASLRADETIMVENKNREGVNLSDLHMGLVHSAVQEFRQQHDLKNEESSEY